jgi:uncharacterized protein (TIGR03067 family)
MLVRALLLVVAGLSVAFDAKDDAVKEELKKLAGTWLIESGEERGKAASKEDLSRGGMRLTFSGTSVAIKINQQDKPFEGTVAIDPTQKPKHIDIKAADVELRGIYSLDGDALKLCVVKEREAKRPPDFTTAKDNAHGLLVFKRENK